MALLGDTRRCIRETILASRTPNQPNSIYQEVNAKLNEKSEGPGRPRFESEITFNSFLTIYHTMRREQKIDEYIENLPILNFEGKTIKLWSTIDDREIVRLTIHPLSVHHVGRGMHRGRDATTYMKEKLMNLCRTIATLDVDDVVRINTQLTNLELAVAKRIDIVQNCLVPLLLKHRLVLIYD
jgi:hypothetical protein